MRDTGIGIPAAKIEQLFQSFSQVDASTTRRYGGTGLGLAISQRLAEMMGGTMWVESVEGKGSTFYFTLAMQAGRSLPQVSLHGNEPELRDKRVLLVDDNQTNRHILTLQCQQWGMKPRAAASGTEALAWLERGDPFDLGILDMQMPAMDGAELASRIRKLRATGLPLVLLTSIGLREERSAANEIFAAYVNKPVKQSQLHNILLEVLARQPTPRKQNALSPQLDAHLSERLPLRILLAEDNAVNQKLALLMLQQMGYRADIAGNGLEVLAALRRQSYDMILMDVQMPEMDGLATARQIVATWDDLGKGIPRPKIIAMTAHAMQGDREECLGAGMDDYISKPIRAADLQAALQRCGQAAGKQAEDTFDPVASAVIDAEVLDNLRALGEDQDSTALNEIIELFLKDAAEKISTLRRAASAGDAAAIKTAVHSLNGNSSSIGAIRMAVLCQELKALGRAEHKDGAVLPVQHLENEFTRARCELQDFAAGKKQHRPAEDE